MADKKARIIAVVSGKGGVGKTTTAINLGAALNFHGQNVTVVDGNVTTPNMGVYLGVPVVPVSLHTVLSGKKEMHEAVYAHKSGTRLVLASLALKDLKKIEVHKLKKAVAQLEHSCDFVIVDSSPGLTKETAAVIEAADEVLIVTNPEMPAVTDALKTIKLSKELHKKVLGVLITKTNVKNADMPLKDIEDVLETQIVGVIPEDRAVKFSHAAKDAVVHTHPKSAAAVQYKTLAAELAGIKYHEPIEPQVGPITHFLLRWFGFR